MIQHRSKIVEVLGTFYRSTGIDLLYFDNQLNYISNEASDLLIYDFFSVGLSRISEYLEKVFAQKETRQGRYFTYFLEGNIACNIVFLHGGDRLLGAFVTQPLAIRKLGPGDKEQYLDRLQVPAENRYRIRSILAKIPFVPYDRVMSLGDVLSSLSGAVFPRAEEIAPEPLPNTPDRGMESKKRKRNAGGGSAPVEALPPSALFDQVKECVRTGDAASLMKAVNGLFADGIAADTAKRNDAVGMLRDSIISLCVLSCYAAIDADAPYDKAMRLCDDYVRRMESSDSVRDMLRLLEDAWKAFAQSSRINSTGPEKKHVRQALDYIREHFAEKITLEALASHVGLHPAHLSKQIRRETGLSLADHVNKARIDQSKLLLLNGGRSLLEVSRQIGYSYQNHFTTTFRHVTGLTPTEFIATVQKKRSCKNHCSMPDDLLKYIADRFMPELSLIRRMVSAARIIDPITHMAWSVTPDEMIPLPAPCCDFGDRDIYSDTCIYLNAYLQNRRNVKMEKRNDEFCLVYAAPETIGNQTYVVEITKLLSGSGVLAGELDTACS